jgi:WD40 repeat protein
MINAGRIGGIDDRGIALEARPATIDKINLTTGEPETIWQITPQATEQYFARVYGIRISPDGQYLAFSSGDRLEDGYSVLLHLIDQEGQEFGEYRETYAHNWRPNGGLVVSDLTDNGIGRLIYIELDGTEEIVYETQIGRITIKGGDDWLDNAGVWSADGRSFAFATRDNGAKTEHLHLWQPGLGPPTPIFTSLTNERIDDFFWVPNSQTLYFNTVGPIGADPNIKSKLWHFDVPTS